MAIFTEDYLFHEPMGVYYCREKIDRVAGLRTLTPLFGFKTAEDDVGGFPTADEVAVVCRS